jgi:competence protein ComGC
MKKTKKRQNNGFSMIDAMIMMMIFTIIIMVYAAIIPSVAKNAHEVNYYSVASAIAQSKVKQLQYVGYNNIKNSGLTITNGSLPKIADGTGTPSLSSNTNGMGSSTFTFTDTEQLWRFFPNGETSPGVRNTGTTAPSGFIYVTPYTPSNYTSGSTTIAGMIQATITISWQLSGRPRSYYTATTLIPRQSF